MKSLTAIALGAATLVALPSAASAHRATASCVEATGTYRLSAFSSTGTLTIDARTSDGIPLPMREISLGAFSEVSYPIVGVYTDQSVEFYASWRTPLQTKARHHVGTSTGCGIVRPPATPVPTPAPVPTPPATEVPVPAPSPSPGVGGGSPAIPVVTPAPRPPVRAALRCADLKRAGAGRAWYVRLGLRYYSCHPLPAPPRKRIARVTG